MGEIADMMLDGILCETCGVLMDDLIPETGNTLRSAPGFPRQCPDCLKSAPRQQTTKNKVTCKVCGKRVKKAGIKDHMKDKHQKGIV
jgi:DNA-directed RNA polymerase subunit RPC12/RpoP